MDDAALRARIEAIIESKTDWLAAVDMGYLHATPGDLAAEIAALFAPVVAELERLEWRDEYGEGFLECAACSGVHPDDEGSGHRPDCTLAAALATLAPHPSNT